MPIPVPTDLPFHTFPTAADFEAFLDREHETASGIYVKLAKKSSGITSITAEVAVEVALCFGWIDGRAGGLDDDWWYVRYTPRRSKSLWSQKNVATVSRLIKEGRMRPAGLVAVEAAKANGKWDRAYAGPATIQVPDDFAAALKGKAKTFFEKLNKSERYAVLWRVQTASPKARPGKIQILVEMLAKGEVPGRESGKTSVKKGATKAKATTKTMTMVQSAKSANTSETHTVRATRRSRRLAKNPVP
jgi:uncharacterized protein YdeI (YjbR/CyaY-like superfamily)